MANARVKVAPARTAHDFIVTTNKGDDLDLGTLSGTAMLVMTVTADCCCAKTDQIATELLDTKSSYQACTELVDKYHNKHFTVLVFPCIEFGTKKHTGMCACERCCGKFQIMEKVNVNGDNANAFWEFLKNQQKGILGTSAIKCPCTSFLIDKRGNVVKRYSPGTTAADIEHDLLPLLA